MQELTGRKASDAVAPSAAGAAIASDSKMKMVDRRSSGFPCGTNSRHRAGSSVLTGDKVPARA